MQGIGNRSVASFVSGKINHTVGGTGFVAGSNIDKINIKGVDIVRSVFSG